MKSVAAPGCGGPWTTAQMPIPESGPAWMSYSPDIVVENSTVCQCEYYCTEYSVSQKK